MFSRILKPVIDLCLSMIVVPRSGGARDQAKPVRERRAK